MRFTYKLSIIVRKYFLLLFLSLFLCLNPVQAQEDKSPSLTRGLQFYNQEKFDQALSQFSQLLKQDPSNIEARYFKGLTFNKAEKFDEAVVTFKKVLELDSKYSGARLQLGIAHFNLKSNVEAIQEFEKVLKQKPQDANAHLYLGFTHQQMEKYEDSLIHFQTAMSLDPSLSQIALFQIGLAFSEMNEKEEAKLAMEMVLEEDSGTETARQAKLMLDYLGGKTPSSQKPWWVTAGMSLQYDDNVILETQDTVSEEGDLSLSYVFGLGTRLALSENSSFQISYDFYQSLWETLEQFDYQSHYFSTSTSYASGNWDGDLTYGFNYSLLDRNDFMAFHSITPRLGFLPKPNLYTSLSYSYSLKNFIADNIRDGDNHSWSLSQFLFFMENKAYAYLSYSLALEDTQDPEFDYLGHTASVGLKVPGPLKISTNLNYNYNFQNYKNITDSIGERRFDATHTAQLVLSRPIIDSLEVNVNVKRVMSNSNLTSVDFTQNVFTLGLEYKM